MATQQTHIITGEAHLWPVHFDTGSARLQVVMSDCCMLQSGQKSICATSPYHMVITLHLDKTFYCIGLLYHDPVCAFIRSHAASVLQMTHLLIHNGLIQQGILDPITMLACYFAGENPVET